MGRLCGFDLEMFGQGRSGDALPSLGHRQGRPDIILNSLSKQGLHASPFVERYSKMLAPAPRSIRWGLCRDAEPREQIDLQPPGHEEVEASVGHQDDIHIIVRQPTEFREGTGGRHQMGVDALDVQSLLEIARLIRDLEHEQQAAVNRARMCRRKRRYHILGWTLFQVNRNHRAIGYARRAIIRQLEAWSAL